MKASGHTGNRKHNTEGNMTGKEPPTECKYCGSNEYYRKVRYSGTGEYYHTFDSEGFADNSELGGGEGIEINQGKRIYCSKCDKCLGTFDRSQMDLK